MFYSHESESLKSYLPRHISTLTTSFAVLTSRKHGVATIWYIITSCKIAPRSLISSSSRLVATLGSKSSLKKITRKAIMDVDVPNACETITDPAAPMALRLQGNLLFGLSRVFSQQCAYILNDMQSLRDKMQGIAVLLKELEVDPDVMAARPEQLNLQPNPDFNIDLDLGFDFSSFELRSSSAEPSSLLSPRTLPIRQSSLPEYEQFLEPGPALEGSSSGNAGDGFDFGFDDLEPLLLEDDGDGAQRDVLGDAEVGPVLDDGELRGEMHYLLDMDEDGTLIIRDLSERGARLSDPTLPDVGAAEGGEEMGDDFELMLDFDDGAAVDVGLPPQLPRSASHDDDDDNGINPADPVQRIQSSPQNLDNQPQDDDNHVNVLDTIEEARTEQQEEQGGEQEDQEDVQAMTATATAPQRSTKLKTVPFDNPAEISNRGLADWNDNYLNYMLVAYDEKAGRVSVAQAKRNAAYWLLDQGLGDVDSNFRGDLEEHPLAIFSGEALIDALMGPSKGSENNRKRSRIQLTEGDGDDTRQGSSGSKRVRTNLGERTSSAADQGQDGDSRMLYDDDEGITFGEEDDEIQVGRAQQEPLSDHPSDMPWNVYAFSRQGSARRGMSVAAASSSAGGRGTFDINLPSSNVKRISQLIRESPLDRRSRMDRASAVPGTMTHQDDTGMFSLGAGFDIDADEVDAQLAGNLDDDFELYGPGAEVSTQEAESGRWIAETLEKEALNFLEFLRTTIEKLEREDNDDDVQTDGEGNTATTFQSLLPPEDNNEIVAAQGLLHVLSLATSGFISVKQYEAFGDIQLSLVNGLAYESEGGNEGEDEQGTTED